MGRGAQCGYREIWTTARSTITYEKTLLNVGRGSMDLGSGVWTAEETGLYQVAWSMFNRVDSGEYNYIYLYKNGGRVDESEHLSSYVGSEGRINDQGGRTMMLELQAGDTLELTDTLFYGVAINIHFCVSLLHAS